MTVWKISKNAWRSVIAFNIITFIGIIVFLLCSKDNMKDWHVPVSVMCFMCSQGLMMHIGAGLLFGYIRFKN